MFEKINLTYNKLTSYIRPLPDFIIIGAQKSGTSSLHKYLCQHPNIKSSFKKEVHFFDRDLNLSGGEFWYRSYFPLRISHDTKIFEASPSYLFNPLVPCRINDLLPNVKLIIMLRNPVERAISHYFHSKKLKRENTTIYEALTTEESRIHKAVSEKNYNSYEFINFSYKIRGIYKPQIEHYLDFFSREKILIINSESFFSKPESTLSKVFNFVDVAPDFRPLDLTPERVGSNKVTVDLEIYEYLNKFFAQHNQDLYDLIGESYNW